MKTKLRILEIGASSLLDFDFNKDIELEEDKMEWTKLYNNNLPQYYSKTVKLDNVLKFDNIFRRELFNKNVFIFSTGNKGPRKLFHEYEPDEVKEVYSANLELIFRFLPEIIKSLRYSNTPIKFIFMGSVAGEDGATYVNHSYYSAMKAALKSLVVNLQEEYKDYRNFRFEYLTIPRLASRMTDEKAGDPEVFRGSFIKLLKK